MTMPKDPEKAALTRKRMSESHKGIIQSEESNKKRSLALKGRTFSEDHRKKLSIAAKGKKKPPFSETWLKHLSESQKGRKHTEETKKKQSFAASGENNHEWRGGLSYLPYCQKFNDEFRERVRAFFGYQCVECGYLQNGKKLHVHHVNFKKDSCCNPDTPRLFVSLCSTCHKYTNGKRLYWEQHFTDMINQYYGGKCYLTKEEMELLK